MYGLIGRITAAAGQRDALIRILLEGIERMPGRLSYIVAEDPADVHAIWVTEVWGHQGQSHRIAVAAIGQGGHLEGAAAHCRGRREHRDGAGGRRWPGSFAS